VTADPHWRGKDIFILDIGGGSAEWVQGRHGKMEKRLSLPLGAVRLRERFLHEYPVAPDTAALLVETIRGQIAHPLAHYTLGSRRLVGTGRNDHLPRRDPQKTGPVRSAQNRSRLADHRSKFARCCGVSPGARWSSSAIARPAAQTRRPDHPRHGGRPGHHGTARRARGCMSACAACAMAC
jgi:hypothetical protein